MSLLGPDDPRHGSYGGYTNHRCRCDACREANTLYHRQRAGRLSAAERFALQRAEALKRHGLKGYRKRGCRCDVCREAEARHRRSVRRRKGMRSVPSLQKYPEIAS